MTSEELDNYADIVYQTMTENPLYDTVIDAVVYVYAGLPTAAFISYAYEIGKTLGVPSGPTMSQSDFDNIKLAFTPAITATFTNIATNSAMFDGDENFIASNVTNNTISIVADTNQDKINIVKYTLTQDFTDVEINVVDQGVGVFATYQTGDTFYGVNFNDKILTFGQMGPFSSVLKNAPTITNIQYFKAIPTIPTGE